MIIVPEEIDLHDYFIIKEVEIGSLPIIGEKTSHAFELGLMINLLGNNFLSIYHDLRNKYGNVLLSDAFEDYKTCLYDREFSSSIVSELLLKYKVECLDDVFKIEGMMRASFKEANHHLIDFSDRETVFNYFYRFLKYDEDNAYSLMERTRKGEFDRKERSDIANNLLLVLENISYLPPRGMVVQLTYYRILMAHYFLKEKENEKNTNSKVCSAGLSSKTK